MDIFKIQALIAQGRLVTTTDVDTDKVYLQVGVFQEGNRQQASSDANTYAPYAISLSDILNNAGGGSSTISTLKKTISLTDPALQSIALPSTGLYIIESAIVTNPSTDLSGFGIMELNLYRPGNINPFLTTIDIGPPSSDQLNLLYLPENYVDMLSSGPTCFPPPCNVSYVYDGSTAGSINFEVVTPALSEATVDVYIKLLRLA